MSGLVVSLIWREVPTVLLASAALLGVCLFGDRVQKWSVKAAGVEVLAEVQTASAAAAIRAEAAAIQIVAESTEGEGKLSLQLAADRMRALSASLSEMAVSGIMLNFETHYGVTGFGETFYGRPNWKLWVAMIYDVAGTNDDDLALIGRVTGPNGYFAEFSCDFAVTTGKDTGEIGAIHDVPEGVIHIDWVFRRPGGFEFPIRRESTIVPGETYSESKFLDYFKR